MKKEIRLCVLHSDITKTSDLNKLFHNSNLEDHFNFVWDSISPDYVIATELIYYQQKYADIFKRLVRDNTITIFTTGESISPDLNIFDYALVFDRGLEFKWGEEDNRIIRIPTLIRYSDTLFPDFLDLLNDKEKIIKMKTKFCNFMYSNPYAHKNRDELFYKICEYKRVESIGPHLNNIGNQTSRNIKDWRRLSIASRMPYKFSIAAENATFRGNITEKLICCFEAGTIPIYWGDPSVSEEFNSKAFINCHDYNNFDEVKQCVKEIDESDDLYYKMLTQPWQTIEQEKLYKQEVAKYQNFLFNIFNQDKIHAKRIGIGYHPTLYHKWFHAEKDIFFTNKQESKLQLYYSLLTKWVDLHINKSTFSTILEKRGYQEIAIYGIGEIGKLLYDELYLSLTNVRYGIDQSHICYKDLVVFSVNDNLPPVDAIIVTIPNAYDEISYSLRNKVKAPIISIEDLLY